MRQMSNFKSNIRDIEFNLFEVGKAAEAYGLGPYANTGVDEARAILGEAAKFAVEVLGEVYEEGDKIGCQYIRGKVTTPPSFKTALKKFTENSWHLMEVAEADGGMHLPHSLVSAVHELFTAANAPLFIYPLMGTLIGNTIRQFGTPEQVARFCPVLFSGKWSGTMCLTEADAGSEVGAIRSKAKKIEGDLYRIEGSKRFISGGEHDLTENIVHLVLARVEGAPAGTKGISMFIIPKIWVNEDGSLGGDNDVACAGIEHKMGFTASATCQMSFGEHGRCRGFLLGGVENRGMRQMFALMNMARICTGIKAMGLASTAYLNALVYCRERLQGVDMKEMMNPQAARVPIIRHPDVRRMLLMQKSKVEAMRALILMTGGLMDKIAVAGGLDAAPEMSMRVDILTPIIKAYCTEEACLSIIDAMQCLGGSGYCRDYPIEQYLRDAKITTVYEGTTHIQAMDLVARKLPMSGGAGFAALMADIAALAAQAAGNSELGPAAGLLQEAQAAVKAQSDKLMEYFTEDLYLIGLNANRFMFSLGELICGWLLLEQALVAQKALAAAPEGHPDRPFYAGKLFTARFFINNILPGVFARSRMMELKDASAMAIAEASLG